MSQAWNCRLLTVTSGTCIHCVGLARSPYTRSLRPDDEGRYKCHVKVNVSGIEIPAAQTMKLIVQCMYQHIPHQHSYCYYYFLFYLFYLFLFFCGNRIQVR